MLDRPDARRRRRCIARARAMIPALAARAPQGERERRLPKETIADMQAAGLFRVLQPKRWGGYEIDIHTYFEVQMALGEGDMSVAWVYGVVGVHPWLVALYDDRAAHDIWGKDDSTLICSSLMPVGAAQAGRRRLSPQRPLEIRQRLRALRLGVPRRHAAGRRRWRSGASSWCRAATTRSSTPGTCRAEGHRQPRHRGQGRVRAGLPDRQVLRQFPRLGAGARGQHRAALPAAVRPGVLPRRLDRRDRRAARHAQRLSRLRQEAHQPAVRPAGVGGSADPADLRRGRLRDRRDEDHPASQLPQPGKLCGARRDAAAEAAHGIQIPQRLGGGALQPAGGAAVQGDRHGRDLRRPAVRPHPRRHQRRAASTSRTSSRPTAAATARRCSASRKPRTWCCDGAARCAAVLALATVVRGSPRRRRTIRRGR